MCWCDNKAKRDTEEREYLYFWSILPIILHNMGWVEDSPKFQQVAQLSQRDRAAGWTSFGQKWKTICRQYSYGCQLSKSVIPDTAVPSPLSVP